MPSPATHSTSQSILQLRNLSKSFREGEATRRVLAGVDATIRYGEIVALLGRSGSGKSTLLNLISGIDQPDGGEIIIKDTVLNQLNEHERTLFRRRHIGFVFQFFNLIPTLTVLENLLLPLELNGRIGMTEKNQALRLLADVGLEERVATFPDRLSGGEQQRVAIARALIHRPELLLADEPTGNLDAETGAQALDLLESLVRSRGAALLMVTHSAETARRADRILSIRDGVLEETAA